jgi:hypothetical protein
MRLRSLGFVAVAAATLMQSCQPACAPEPPAGPPPDITSITVTGQGSGHGRGMSAWGAFGWAINGISWTDILDYYYSGTAFGLVANQPIGVRLLGLDGSPVTAVMSESGRAIWNGVAYGAVRADWRGGNRYEIYTSPTRACPNTPNVAWTSLGLVDSPPNAKTITFWTDVPGDATGGDVLGLCQPNGTVTHYRGSISPVVDARTGTLTTVNDVLLEDYLRGVLPREVPSSWGNSAGGAGMNALWAFAVAGRSFAVSQNRYAYAKTCDTATCQVYGGAAYRADALQPTSWPGPSVCLHSDPMVAAQRLSNECAISNRAVAETAGYIRIWPDTGAIVSTEYSASHGPYSAGVSFPVRDDSVSNQPGNPNYSWTRTVDAAAIEARYGLGNLIGAYSEPDPSSSAYGVWAYRVVLQGSDRTVATSNLEFRNGFGFPSHGFTITAVNR